MTTRIFALMLALLVIGCDGDTDGTDSGTGGGDTGMPMTDSGPAPTGCPTTLPDVAIRFSGCTAIAACGGDPTGVWVYDDVCVENPVPDISAICASARVEDLMGTARGCVDLDGTSVTRNVSGEVMANVIVPTSCTFGMGCAPVESALGVTCTESGGECICPYETSWTDTSTDTYTVSGTTLTTGDGTSYEFCVAGDGLDYEEGGGSPGEPGVTSLTR